MKILAIDTSSRNAAVAITENEEILIELNNSDEKTHSQKLMPMIDEAFKKTELSLDNIDLITCGIGPGSFTGVRIGIATAKAFCDSKNIPTIGINTSEELAYNLNTEGYVCSLVDAGHGNCYAGFFEIVKDEQGQLQTKNSNLKFLDLKDENAKLSEKNLLNYLQENLTEFSKNNECENNINSQNVDENNCVNNIDTNSTNKIVYFVGDGTENYPELFEKLKNKAQDLFEIKISEKNQNIVSGITLAKLGYTKYKNGESGNSSALSPVYLRKSQAELALEEKNNKL